MSELVQNNENGFTFKVGSKTHLKEVITKIINNPNVLNELKNSRDSVVDIKDDAKEIIKIYKQLV